MRSLAVLLIVLGAGSLLLPLVGMQFRLLEPLDPYQPFAGIMDKKTVGMEALVRWRHPQRLLFRCTP